MASPKTTEFDRVDVELARYADALSHPARIAILKTLSARKGCVCGELVEVMPLAQSTVSQHLKVLKESGLVKGEVDGPRSCYCVNPEAVKKAGALLDALIERLSKEGEGDGQRKTCRREP